jgi:FG-GAP-like repeat
MQMTKRQNHRWALALLLCASWLLPPFVSGLHAQNLLGSNPALPQFQARTLAWADYDGDGDQDLFAAGADGNGLRQSRLLRNDGATTFVAVPIPVPALGDAAAAWSDIDGDGDLDLVASGSVATRVAHLAWYRNDGGGTFTVQALPAGGLQEGTVSVGDLDGDGDTDLLLTGWNPQKLDMTLVLRNGGGGAFTLAWDDQHPGLSGSSADIGDYDGDGDLDVVLTGRGVDVLPQTWVLRNQGGLQFYRW